MLETEYMLSKHTHELADITGRQRDIVKVLAKKGLKAYYDLYRIEKVGSSSTIWEGLDQLQKKGLVEAKIKRVKDTRHGKPKKPFGLTFKGLLYALNMGFIKPSEARETRIHNEVEFLFSSDIEKVAKRLSSYPKQMRKLLGDQMKRDLIDVPLILEKEFSEEIYSYLMKYVNLNFYAKSDTENVWLWAVISLGKRAMRVSRTHGSVQISDEMLSALLEGQLGEISVGALYWAIHDRAMAEFEQIRKEVNATTEDHIQRDEALERLLKCKPEDVPKALDAMIKKFKLNVSRDELMKKLKYALLITFLEGRAAPIKTTLKMKSR